MQSDKSTKVNNNNNNNTNNSETNSNNNNPVNSSNPSLTVSPGVDYGTVSRTSQFCSSLRDYQILSKLGEGTFGEVYHARHTSSSRSVAIKRVRIKRIEEG